MSVTKSGRRAAKRDREDNCKRDTVIAVVLMVSSLRARNLPSRGPQSRAVHGRFHDPTVHRRDPRRKPRRVRRQQLKLNLKIWNGAVYCTQVAPDVPKVSLRCTLV